MTDLPSLNNIQITHVWQ